MPLLGILGFHLGLGQSLKDPKMPLAKTFVQNDLMTCLIRNNPSCLESSAKIAAVKLGEIASLQPVGHGFCLSDPGLGQRAIPMPLPSSIKIGLGLTVTYDD